MDFSSTPGYTFLMFRYNQDFHYKGGSVQALNILIHFEMS